MPSLAEKLGTAAGAGAARSKWVMRGAWVLALAEVAMVVKGHLDRLDPGDATRLADLVKKSKGRPSNLSIRERNELRGIVNKIEPSELAKAIAGTATGVARRPR